MNDLTKILNNPEDYYPGNFDTPQRANALLTGLCQDAANEIAKLQAEVERLKASIAFDKMAENACELGLDYEPAVQEGRDWSLLEATQESLREHMAEIKRLKAAQPAPVQLTGEQIEHLWETRVSQPCPSYPLEKSDWVQFARAIEAAHGITAAPAAQPAPVKTYSGGKPWPVAPAPDPAPIIQQLVTALEGSGTRMRSDQWYVEIEAVAAGKFYLNSKGEGL
jgi:uncharacterized small protein (DUF1192 family)